MRRTHPARGAALAALAMLTALALLGAGEPKKGEPKKKKPPEVVPKVDENIGSVARIIQGELPVSGIGLVVGLPNTGSTPPPSSQRAKLLDVMKKAGIEHADKLLERPDVSMVLVGAVLPNGLGTRDPIDVTVTLPAASGTTSLAGGKLIMTELAPVVNTAQGPKEGKVMAVAGGPIMIGDGADPNNGKVGRVLGGGRVKADIPYNLVIRDERRGVRTAKIVEDAVKTRFHQSDGLDQKGMATTTRTDNQLILRVPKVYHHNQGRYFQVIEQLALRDSPDLRAKRMQTWAKELLDVKTAGKAAIKLEGLGANSIPILKEGLASANIDVRFFAAESLAYMGNVDGVDVLEDAAIKRPEFRSYALKALAASSTDQAAGLMRLRNLMSQAEVELRYGAFDALRTFDETDPFLGQIAVVDDKAQGDGDPLALQIDDAPRRRRIPTREAPFSLYIVDCEGPPLVHVSRNIRSEIVIFGRGQKLMTPVVLGAGGAVLLNASLGDSQVQISRITPSTLDQADSRVSSSLDIAEIIRQAARVGATYPDVVNILAGASMQKNLPGPLIVDAVPMPNKAYSEIQLLGKASKKDDEVKKAKAEEEKKPRLFDRLFNRTKD